MIIYGHGHVSSCSFNLFILIYLIYTCLWRILEDNRVMKLNLYFNIYLIFKKNTNTKLVL